jgi:hypothetical protein
MVEPFSAVQPPEPLRGLTRGAALLAVALSCAAPVHLACGSDDRRSTLPVSLSDEEFWGLTVRLSEPAGAFTHSDNLVSNEGAYAHTIRVLRAGGGVYIGVGPEQNFSYIARLRPAMAFIIDIRRENLNLHLLYKALFELSDDRADFLSRLFSRERPADVGRGTGVHDLFRQYEAAATDPYVFEQNLRLVRARLVDGHGFPLTPHDLDVIEHALKAFFSEGPAIHYGRSRPKDSPGPSYRALMTAADARGVDRSYLATDEAFAFVKDLHARNMIVPVVGDFAGPHAIRGTGNYIRQHRGVVAAFYGSNVEVYLSRERMQVFCANLATLPYGPSTWFVDSKGLESFRWKLKSCAPGVP